MSAVRRPAPPDFGREPMLRAMTRTDLDAVLAIERAAYGWPWTSGNFADSLAAGHLAELLQLPGGGIVGYYVAMPGAGELHLLNLTVAPPHQRRGHARTLLDVVEQRCRELRLPTVWLEVRVGNARARQVYLRRGFVEAGLRRGYYPAGSAGNEDALLMRRDVPPEPADALD